MSKKNIILGIILVILVVLAWAYQGPYQDYRKKQGQPDNFLSEVDIDKIDKIIVTRIMASTTLEKVGDRWKVAGTKDFYVKTDLADEITKKLNDLKKSELELVSTNKEKRVDFKTDPVLGTKVALFSSGNKQAEFVIGKVGGSNFSSSYIGTPTDDNTYSVNLFLQSPFELSDWRDNTIFSSDKSVISKIRFQYPSREFTVEKKDGEWKGTIPYQFDVSQEKVDEVLDVMTSLEAASIPVQKFEGTGLEKHSIIVEVSGDGVDNLLMVGDKDDEGRYYVKKGDSDNIYLITEVQKDILDKTIDKLK